MDERVSEFICSSTFADIQPNPYRFNGWVKMEMDDYRTVSGSTSELYILPEQSCIGDTDIMLTNTRSLAVVPGRPLPQRLPSYFKNVQVMEIVSSDCFPGYVRQTIREIGRAHV